MIVPKNLGTSFAFIGWNPFQLKHALSIAQRLPNATILIEKRKQHIYQFDEALLTETGLPTVIWRRDNVRELDGAFDVFVCQTPFSQMDDIRRSAVAMVQYGYAKSPHNYGAWRAKAALCLVYGPHADAQIRPWCPTAIVGPPHMDAWYDSAFHERARQKIGPLLDANKPTILYAPTWGELSTLPQYIDAVLSLSDAYNVLLKMHHNTDLLSQTWRAKLLKETTHLFGANDDLLSLFSVCDAVLSDYSGAIFDALYCERPVVLLHDQTTSRMGAKLDVNSLEYAERHRIGPVLESPALLRQTLGDVLNGTVDFQRDNRAFVDELYLREPGAAQRAADVLQQYFGE